MPSILDCESNPMNGIVGTKSLRYHTLNTTVDCKKYMLEVHVRDQKMVRCKHIQQQIRKMTLHQAMMGSKEAQTK